MRPYVLLALVAGCGFGIGFGDNSNRASGVGDDAPAIDAAVADAEVPVDAVFDESCSLVPQRGCPSGDACDLGASADETACREVTFDGTEDARCTDRTECAAGFLCAEIGAVNACERFCTSDAQCSGAGARCVIQLRLDGELTEHKACSNACDPLESTGCPTGLGCYVHPGGAEPDFTTCNPPGTRRLAQSCDDRFPCEPGLACADGFCAELCDRALDGFDCTFGDLCLAFDEPLQVGGTRYGVCN